MSIQYQSWIGKESLHLRIAPSSNTSELGSEHTRSRSSMACLECRARKIRCDLSVKRATCTNCKTNARACSTKRRTRRARCEIPVENYQRLGSYTAPTPQECSSGPTPQSTSSTRQDLDSPGILPSGHAVARTFDLNGWSWQQSRFTTDKPTMTQTTHPFVKIGTSHLISEDDMEFLRQRECFDLPESHLMGKLCREYFAKVHPQLPMLDEDDFLQLCQTTDRSDGVRAGQVYPISLLVLHGMIHVACSVSKTAIIMPHLH